MKIIPEDEVKNHNTEDSCWVVRRGKVFDVTKFIHNHPGGAETILEFGGNDVTTLMTTRDVHIHSKNAYKTLADMQIGILEGHEHMANAADEYKEPVDWSKPLLAQVGSLGKQYNQWVHEPVDRWVRLFKSDAMEMISRAPWYFVPIFWIPIIIYNLMQAYTILSESPSVNILGQDIALQPWMIPFLVICGALSWPFIEYFLHRFVFHMEPSSGNETLIRLHFTTHGLHHKAPFDPYHLVFPPIPAALIGVVVFTTYSLLLSPFLVNAWFAGTAAGYIFYDLTHYYIHHGHPEPNSYFGRLKKWHIRHHYIDWDNGFGVSSSALDFPFGTDFPHFKYH